MYTQHSSVCVSGTRTQRGKGEGARPGRWGSAELVPVLLRILRPFSGCPVPTRAGGWVTLQHRRCSHELALVPTATLPAQDSAGRWPRVQTFPLPSPPWIPLCRLPVPSPALSSPLIQPRPRVPACLPVLSMSLLHHFSGLLALQGPAEGSLAPAPAPLTLLLSPPGEPSSPSVQLSPASSSSHFRLYSNSPSAWSPSEPLGWRVAGQRFPGPVGQIEQTVVYLSLFSTGPLL